MGIQDQEKDILGYESEGVFWKRTAPIQVARRAFGISGAV